MKARTEAAPAPRIFPIARVLIADLLHVADDNQLINMLEDRMRQAFEHYIGSYADYCEKMRGPDSYRLKGAERWFRGVEDYLHPLSRQRWASDGDKASREQLARAIAAEDWQEAMVCAGMLCVRDMIHGRAVEPKKALAGAGAKAVAKTAKKRAAPKKPQARARAIARTPAGARARRAAAAAPQAQRGSKTEKLKALVEQARPLFKANPALDREGLVKKIGRAYERLTSFAELKVLCAGKTPTTHSLKKAGPEKPAPLPRTTLSDTPGWPFPTKSMPAAEMAAPKAKRPRRDPIPKAGQAAPAAAPSSAAAAPAPAAGAGRTKPWPQPSAIGTYRIEDAGHQAEFKSGEVVAHFAAIETPDGWTYGGSVKVESVGFAHLVKPLTDKGPLEITADGAIRNISADLLAEVKHWLIGAEIGAGDGPELVPHVADIEKLRAWLLGFQARGVEKIAFLKKGGQLELAA